MHEKQTLFRLAVERQKSGNAERIAAHKIARSKVSVFLMACPLACLWRLDLLFTFPLSPSPVFTGINPSGGRPLLYTRLILLAVCGTSLFTSSVMTVMAKVGALLAGEHG